MSNFDEDMRPAAVAFIKEATDRFKGTLDVRSHTGEYQYAKPVMIFTLTMPNGSPLCQASCRL